MYVTVLTGHVKTENWATLEQSFALGIKHSPDELLHSMLIQCEEEPGLWKIITTWRSREDFERSEKEHRTSPCVQMFCNAGAAPRRQLFTTVRQYERV